MNKKIFVFPCGSEIGLEIHKSLQYAKGITLYGGSSVVDHGRMVYENYIDNIPSVSEKNFIEKINEIISEHGIDYIVPAHDSVVLKLAQNQNILACEVITSNKETCEICRSKKKTYEFFEGYKFIPKLYNSSEEVLKFPIFMKPDVGQGSKGVAMAYSYSDIEYNLSLNSDLLILEYLPGDEYTIDCFTDRKGQLRFIGQRARNRIKSGISVNSYNTPYTEEVLNIANDINKKLKLRGAWFFQLKKDKSNNLKLLEIAPRIAGTMSLYRNKGINFPLLSIFDRENYDIDIIENNFDIEVDRALINRFFINYDYDNVFIDFDDTITRNGLVNPMVIAFLYQSVQKNKNIYLITKHKGNIDLTLKRFCINKDLFKDIIHIKQTQSKYSYLKKISSYKLSIFIDDSFKERLEISQKLNIPVFDIDSIESLIDWRI